MPPSPDSPDARELVAVLRDRFDELTPPTRRAIVALVAASLEEQARQVEDGQDVLDELERALAASGPEPAIDALTTIDGHLDAARTLRTQYRRAPKAARGAVKRTASTAARTAGTPKRVARPAIDTLLSMPDEDWQLVLDTFQDLSARFAAEPA